MRVALATGYPLYCTCVLPAYLGCGGSTASSPQNAMGKTLRYVPLLSLAGLSV